MRIGRPHCVLGPAELPIGSYVCRPSGYEVYVRSTPPGSGLYCLRLGLRPGNATSGADVPVAPRSMNTALR